MTLATRTIVVPVAVDNRGRVLLCRMAPDRGVFPGQWALPGGGLEAGERLEEALRREAREELGAEIADLKPLFFKDAVLDKTQPDGTRKPLHMIFLVYRCTLASESLVLNSEFSECAWFTPTELAQLELNDLTRDTLTQAGFLAAQS